MTKMSYFFLIHKTTSVRRKYYKLNIVILLTTILKILVKYYGRAAGRDAYLGNDWQWVLM